MVVIAVILVAVVAGVLAVVMGSVVVKVVLVVVLLVMVIVEVLLVVVAVVVVVARALVRCAGTVIIAMLAVDARVEVSGMAVGLFLDALTGMIRGVRTNIGVDMLVDVNANVFAGVTSTFDFVISGPWEEPRC